MAIVLFFSAEDAEKPWEFQSKLVDMFELAESKFDADYDKKFDSYKVGWFTSDYKKFPEFNY